MSTCVLRPNPLALLQVLESAYNPTWLSMVPLPLNSSEFEASKRNLKVKTKIYFDHLETVFSLFFYVAVNFIASIFSKDTL